MASQCSHFAWEGVWGEARTYTEFRVWGIGLRLIGSYRHGLGFEIGARLDSLCVEVAAKHSLDGELVDVSASIAVPVFLGALRLQFA